MIGGFGGGPWLDGRVRLAHTAIGYAEKWLDSKTETYANVAKISLDAFTALIERRARRPPDQGLDRIRAMATAIIDGITTRYEVIGLRAAAADVLAGGL